MWTDNQSKESNYLSKKSVHIEMCILKNETSGQLPVDKRSSRAPSGSNFEKITQFWFLHIPIYVVFGYAILI